jgi:hypothetical protein
MATVVVAGALANKPANGGAAWTRLSWALGFKRLGYSVYFVEQISPSICTDSSDVPSDVADSINLAYFTKITEEFGLDAGLIVDGTSCSFGLSWNELLDVAGSADVLINISGHLTAETLKARFRKRVFIDLDPGYTQFWHAQGLAEERLRQHDLYFTVGENIGQPSCDIPAGGDITWRPIRQPVVLAEWPVAPLAAATPPRFTTVASWRGPLGRAVYRDRIYGVKAHEFRAFAELPMMTAGAFEIALDAHSADGGDVQSLRDRGWTIVDPKRVAADPNGFRDYVQGSSAEFSIAQGVYVETASGWFSDRTVRYLASGKPVLVQDTGWTRNYPSGCGLTGFSTLEQAAAGTERIAGDYNSHSRAARAIAEEFFDSSKVLTGLLSFL